MIAPGVGDGAPHYCATRVTTNLVMLLLSDLLVDRTAKMWRNLSIYILVGNLILSSRRTKTIDAPPPSVLSVTIIIMLYNAFSY